MDPDQIAPYGADTVKLAFVLQITTAEDYADVIICE